MRTALSLEFKDVDSRESGRRYLSFIKPLYLAIWLIALEMTMCCVYDGMLGKLNSVCVFTFLVLIFSNNGSLRKYISIQLSDNFNLAFAFSLTTTPTIQPT